MTQCPDALSSELKTAACESVHDGKHLLTVGWVDISFCWSRFHSFSCGVRQQVYVPNVGRYWNLLWEAGCTSSLSLCYPVSDDEGRLPTWFHFLTNFFTPMHACGGPQSWGQLAHLSIITYARRILLRAKPKGTFNLLLPWNFMTCVSTYFFSSTKRCASGNLDHYDIIPLTVRPQRASYFSTDANLLLKTSHLQRRAALPRLCAQHRKEVDKKIYQLRSGRDAGASIASTNTGAAN